MKFAVVLPFAALGSAFVLPDPNIFSQVAIHDHGEQHDEVPAKSSLASWLGDTLDYLPQAVRGGIHKLEDKFYDDLDTLSEEDEDDEYDIGFPLAKPHDGDKKHGHHLANLTIWEIISKSNHTTKFAKIVSEHEGIVELLNSTKANHTLFVPVDSAFKHIPEDHEKPSDEFVEALLKYHIGLDAYPARDVITAHTLPTVLNESWLGDKPQRLRTRVGLGGWNVNFYSKIVAANLPAKNGVIHAVNHILVPPPLVGRLLTLFPTRFSTLLLAYEKTDFVSFIHGVKLEGSTVFAPSNDAFARLGPAANAFLFNTEKGIGYLRALLKYHIVANTTLYSDEIYRAEEEGGDVGIINGHTHVDLPSLLGDKSIAVDIARWKVFVRVTLNGYVPVTVQDGVAKNGVVHVVGRVPIPPHEHKGEGDDYDGGEISVDDLIARLAPYVDGEDGDDETEPAGEL